LPFAAAVLESFPGLGAGRDVGDGAVIFGCWDRADSSKAVGRVVKSTVIRPCSCLSSGEGDWIGSTVTVTVSLDLMGSSSVNLVTFDVLRPPLVGDLDAATSTDFFMVTATSWLGKRATPISVCWLACSSLTLNVTGTADVPEEEDVFDTSGSTAIELLLDAAEGKSSGVVMAVPNSIGGSAGTGGMPGARELVRGAREFWGADWFGSETLRDRPGCNLWTNSVSLVGLAGLETVAGVLAEGGIETLCRTTGFISSSSRELVESPELSTGDGVMSLIPKVPEGGRGIRPVDTLLEDRLVRDESTSLSTSLPFTEMLPASIGL